MSRTFPYVFAKAISSLIGGLIGYVGSSLLIRYSLLDDPINMLYLSLLGLLLAYLMSTPLARQFERTWQTSASKLGSIPPQAVLAAGVGATTALVITVLLNSLLQDVPGFTWYWSLLLTVILVIASSWFFVANRQLLNITAAVGRGAEVKEKLEPPLRLKLIDTSAIIDGRIADVAGANFMDGKLLIPRFVLNELQSIADSHDSLTRNKGRRGLEVLDKLISQKTMATEVITDDVADVNQVDEKLIRLCLEKDADLITTDYNLNRVAGLQGVKVLNVNQLANAVKPIFLPGERLALHIVKEGREPSQGLGYLEDGTMVVVEEGIDFVGSTVDVVVTSHLQTNMGRMIFARPNEG